MRDRQLRPSPPISRGAGPTPAGGPCWQGGARTPPGSGSSTLPRPRSRAAAHSRLDAGREPPTVVMIETGETAGWFGAARRRSSCMPGHDRQLHGRHRQGPNPGRSRTTRTTWSTRPDTDGPQPGRGPRSATPISNRFVLMGRVGCGETKRDARPNGGPAQPPFLPEPAQPAADVALT